MLDMDGNNNVPAGSDFAKKFQVKNGHRDIFLKSLLVELYALLVELYALKNVGLTPPCGVFSSMSIFNFKILQTLYNMHGFINTHFFMEKLETTDLKKR